MPKGAPEIDSAKLVAPGAEIVNEPVSADGGLRLLLGNLGRSVV